MQGCKFSEVVDMFFLIWMKRKVTMRLLIEGYGREQDEDIGLDLSLI